MGVVTNLKNNNGEIDIAFLVESRKKNCVDDRQFFQVAMAASDERFSAARLVGPFIAEGNSN